MIIIKKLNGEILFKINGNFNINYYNPALLYDIDCKLINMNEQLNISELQINFEGVIPLHLTIGEKYIIETNRFCYIKKENILEIDTHEYYNYTQEATQKINLMTSNDENIIGYKSFNCIFVSLKTINDENHIMMQII